MLDFAAALLALGVAVLLLLQRRCPLLLPNPRPP